MGTHPSLQRDRRYVWDACPRPRDPQASTGHATQHESPAARSLAGKAPLGVLTLGLSQHGNEVGIELGDDGAGLDLARIRAKAEAQGLAVVEGQEAELIFTPGFSTAERLTELAGS